MLNTFKALWKQAIEDANREHAEHLANREKSTVRSFSGDCPYTARRANEDAAYQRSREAQRRISEKLS